MRFPIHVDCRVFKRPCGVTLIEFLVSLLLSLVVVLIATTLLLSSQAAYTLVDDTAVIQESSRYALEIIARTLRQARYQDWDAESIARLTQLTDSASIIGLDARTLKSTAAAMEAPVNKAVNGSDVLGIRFYGSGNGDHGDGTMLNCAGFGVASTLKPGMPDGRSWSIFYVAEDATGEPELRCKYQGKSGWSSVAIARGVESFQVLYGIDTDMDGLPNHFLTAGEVYILDEGLLLAGADSASRLLDKNRKTNWKKVVAVKVALLVRGSRSVRTDGLNKTYHLFGSDYNETHGLSDTGSRIDEITFPLKSRNRIRKIFTATVMLRNADPGAGA